MTTKKPIDTAELADLEAHFGRIPIWEATIEMAAPDWTHYQHIIDTDRRAEVVLVLPRPSGRVVLIRKDHYPAGIYRLPTGGVNRDESVLDAAEREAWEEGGLPVEVEKVLGIVDWTFKHQSLVRRFASYCCRFPLSAQALKATDPHERISSYREAPVQDLYAIAQQLRSVPDDWIAWGMQRAEPHALVWELLKCS